MGAFIQNNIIWLVPIISIIFTITIKIAAKPEFMTLGHIDYFDFGFDLAITSIIVLLSGCKDEVGIWLLLLSFVVIMITSILVNRMGWNKETKQQNWFGVIFPDVIGVILLIVATLYVGGAIK